MRHGLILVSAVIVAAPAAAQSDQIRRGPMPDWAAPSEAMPVPAETSGPVFVRRQDMVVHLGAKGQAQYVGYRIKLLDPNALQLGNISIAWNPVAGAPIVHAIKVHRDGAVVDALQSAKFENTPARGSARGRTPRRHADGGSARAGFASG